MKIIADAFGGDNAPLEIIKGCLDAQKAYGVEILLVGDTKKIQACAAENGLDIQNFELLQADDVFQMETQPTEILKAGKNTSMAVGLQALADGKGDAFISAGSTGALLVGATFIVKRIKGVKRPALGAVMPSAEGPFILVDTGANVECTVPMLCQFARLGDIYMKKSSVFKIRAWRLPTSARKKPKARRCRSKPIRRSRSFPICSLPAISKCAILRSAKPTSWSPTVSPAT